MKTDAIEKCVDACNLSVARAPITDEDYQKARAELAALKADSRRLEFMAELFECPANFTFADDTDWSDENQVCNCLEDEPEKVCACWRKAIDAALKQTQTSEQPGDAGSVTSTGKLPDAGQNSGQTTAPGCDTPLGRAIAHFKAWHDVHSHDLSDPHERGAAEAYYFCADYLTAHAHEFEPRKSRWLPWDEAAVPKDGSKFLAMSDYEIVYVKYDYWDDGDGIPYPWLAKKDHRYGLNHFKYFCDCISPLEDSHE